MPKYIRPQKKGASIFFTVRLARGSTLLVPQIDRLRAAVQLAKQERPFEIEAWVVLPDHMHCIWKMPEGDRDYATRWRLIKSRFSRGLPKGHLRASHELRSERGIWQRRYWEHHIRDQDSFDAHLRYCWFNPVKHGYVEDPLDWPYSSARSDPRYEAMPVFQHSG